MLVSASFVRAEEVSALNGSCGGRSGSCLVYKWEYLCSWRIICSRMLWSGLLSFVVVSMRMFVETLDWVAVEDGDER